MNHRERTLAVLHNRPYDRLPIVHFGFWEELIDKWHAQGHLSAEETAGHRDNAPEQRSIAAKLGFDFNWHTLFAPYIGLRPCFERKTIRELPDGSRHELNSDGVIVLTNPNAGSIPAEVEHTLVDRESWLRDYRWRFDWKPERVEEAFVPTAGGMLQFANGGLEFLTEGKSDYPLGISCGSAIGRLRDLAGLVGLSYLLADDEALVDEILEVTHELAYRCVAHALERGARFDFGHFWEDMCYNSGPLVSPKVFAAKNGPHYRRMAALLAAHGTDLISVDCDGQIDALIPIWIENGVNIMFPIEVGTWEAAFSPWRERYGEAIKGIGGTDKRVFAKDRTAVDAEIERLRPIVEAGGYIPCPDHRLPPETEWDLVRHYTDRLKETFSR